METIDNLINKIENENSNENENKYNRLDKIKKNVITLNSKNGNIIEIECPL